MHMARAPWERMVAGRLFSRHPKLSCVCVCVVVVVFFFLRARVSSSSSLLGPREATLK